MKKTFQKMKTDEKIKRGGNFPNQKFKIKLKRKSTNPHFPLR